MEWSSHRYLYLISVHIHPDRIDCLPTMNCHSYGYWLCSISCGSISLCEFMKNLIKTDLSVAAKFRDIDDSCFCLTESNDGCSYLDLNIKVLNGKFVQNFMIRGIPLAFQYSIFHTWIAAYPQNQHNSCLTQIRPCCYSIPGASSDSVRSRVHEQSKNHISLIKQV